METDHPTDVADIATLMLGAFSGVFALSSGLLRTGALALIVICSVCIVLVAWRTRTTSLTLVPVIALPIFILSSATVVPGVLANLLSSCMLLGSLALIGIAGVHAYRSKWRVTSVERLAICAVAVIMMFLSFGTADLSGGL